MDRLETLSTQVRNLRQQVERQAAQLKQVTTQRPPAIERPRETRIVKTVKQSTEYPTSGDTFAIQFVDGEFTAGEGTNAISWTPRSDDDKPHTFARSLRGEYIGEGTYCLAHHIRGPMKGDVKGEWWLDPACEIRLGKADVDILNGASGAVSWYRGATGAETDTTINFTCKNRFAPVAANDWVMFVKVDAAYYLLPSGGGGSSSTIIRFQLTEALGLGGAADAIDLATSAAIEVNDWYIPGSDGMFAGEVGYRGMAVLIDDAYQIIWMEGKARWIQFTAQADYDAGSKTINVIVDDYHLQGHDPEAPLLFFAVHDPNGHFSLAKNGAKGKAEYNDREDRYEIVTCEQQVINGYATLDGAMCGDASGPFAVTGFHGKPAGEHVQEPAVTYVTNPYKHSAKSGKLVDLEFDRNLDSWEVVDVEKEYIDVLVSDIYVTGCAIKKKTMKMSVETCEDIPTTPDGGGTLDLDLEWYDYSTTCVDGYLYEQSRTVHANPCDGLVTYGEWTVDDAVLGSCSCDPFQLEENDTVCEGGVLTYKLRTVDVNPCVDSEEQVVYGEWVTVGTGGCCACPPSCCDFEDGDQICVTITSDPPVEGMDGVMETLTYSAEGGGFSGGDTVPVTLACTDGEWQADIMAMCTADEASFDCTSMTGSATWNDSPCGPSSVITATFAQCEE